MTAPGSFPIDKVHRDTRLRDGVVVGLCALVAATAIGVAAVPATLRSGAVLGAASAALVAGWAVLLARRAMAQPQRPGADPVLVAFVVGFLAKLAVLAGGTLALQFSGQTVFHPFAFAIAFAAGVIVFALPATWFVVGGRR